MVDRHDPPDGAADRRGIEARGRYVMAGR